MKEEDYQVPCEGLPESEKRSCFGKCIRGPVQYFSLSYEGTEVEVMVESDSGSNKTGQPTGGSR